MKQFARTIVLGAVLSATAVVLFAATAEAVPSFTRKCSVQCSLYHSMWGALNDAGTTFKLSGYRARLTGG
jgi:hypothetical protein